MNKDQWIDLLSHVKSCADEDCCCESFCKNFLNWSKALPLTSSQAPSDISTWLWFGFNKSGFFRWTCVACDKHLRVMSQREWDEEKPQKKVQISNLMYHHNSTSHKVHMAELLGDDADLSFVVPPKSLFKELLLRFQKGEAIGRDGFDLKSGRIGQRKATAMLWTLNESVDDRKRSILGSAETINVIRDEAHGRMHVRYRSSQLNSSQTHAGYMGQSRGHRQDSLGITEATKKVYKDTFTKRKNKPAGCDPAILTEFDAAGFDHAVKVTEAVSIDSAENEVVSATDMKSTGEFPNCDHTLRDAAHSARRLLSRLFNADPVMANVWKFFMAITSIIHWSDELRKLYQECTEASGDAAVTTKFQLLRAAKHRIESWLTPLSRAVLDPSGELLSTRYFRPMQ